MHLNLKVFAVSLLFLSGSAFASVPTGVSLPWQAGPGNTLRAPGRITKLQNISKEAALYRLTGHGTRSDPVLSAQNTGTVPEATICFGKGSPCIPYPFLGRFYAPGTEPLKLYLNERVWLETNQKWPAFRVFPRGSSMVVASPAKSAAPGT